MALRNYFIEDFVFLIIIFVFTMQGMFLIFRLHSCMYAAVTQQSIKRLHNYC